MDPSGGEPSCTDPPYNLLHAGGAGREGGHLEIRGRDVVRTLGGAPTTVRALPPPEPLGPADPLLTLDLQFLATAFAHAIPP